MRFLSHFSGAVVAFALFYLISLLQQDHPVISYARNYSSNVVVAGEVVRVNSDVDRAYTCSSTVVRTWIDQNGNIILETMEELKYLAAGHEPYSSDVKIPENAQPGVLRQRVKTIFYCNWLQRFLNVGSIFVMPDVIFTVKDS